MEYILFSFNIIVNEKRASARGVIMEFSKSTSQKRAQSDAKVQPKADAPQKAKSPHKIELDHLHSVSMTGVIDVPTFTDKTVVVRLEGETLTINGNDLVVKNLDVENGTLQISGQINTLKYSAQSSPSSFAKRIFK